MKLTAKTITDEQIRALRLDPATTFAERRWCAVALDEFGMGSKVERRRMRARCAEILNARAEASK